MKKLLLTAFCMAHSALALAASEVKILSFTVAREGGGEFSAVVTREADGSGSDSVSIYTKSCGFQELSKDQQMESRFKMSGQEAKDAAMILSNKAILASNQSIDLSLTGTFPVFYVTYEYRDMNDEMKKVRRKINRPVVAINGKISMILDRIEDKARAASVSFCS